MSVTVRRSYQHHPIKQAQSGRPEDSDYQPNLPTSHACATTGQLARIPYRDRRMIRSRRGRGQGTMMRMLLALMVGLVSLVSYCSSTRENPITGKDVNVTMSPDQEIALGRQAMPRMVQQHGGLDRRLAARRQVERVGTVLLRALNQQLREKGRHNPYEFEFHLLSDRRQINAFALPGGQVFITAALFDRLETEGQLAGVLGHEIGHVVAQHGAQRLAKQQLTQGLVGAAGVAGGSVDSARIAAAIGSLVNMKYGREDELESDEWGIRLMAAAGYDPRSMLGVMKILDEASKGGPPEFLSTHPKPSNRAQYIQGVIRQVFTDGIPQGLML